MNKDGNYAVLSYGLERAANKLREAKGGPDSGWSEADIAGVSPDTTSFYEVHLTSTGADLKFNGNTIHTINLAPTDTQYRFACATAGPNHGYTDLSYFTS